MGAVSEGGGFAHSLAWAASIKHGGAARYRYAAPLLIVFSEAVTPFTNGPAVSIVRTAARLDDACPGRGQSRGWGFAYQKKGEPVPQPLLSSLSLRNSWLLPGVLESGQNILERGRAGRGGAGGQRGGLLLLVSRG